MRTILTRILTMGGLALLALPSCKNNDPVISSSSTKVGALNASATSLVLDRTRTNDASPAVTFNFTSTQYSFKAAPLGTNLEVDSVGDNWKNPQVISLTKGATTMSFSTIDLDALLLKVVPPDVSSKVNVRIQYQLSSYVSDYSNVITMTVTPFKATAWLYITGVFSGWVNPGALEDSLISVSGNGIYTGIINFTNANGPGDNEFLVLPAKNWTNKYATNDPTGSTSSTVTYNAPNNFYAPAALGYYIVTVDINAGKITFQPCDFYSVIGSAPPGTAWSTDTPMKFVNDGTNTWVANGIPMVVGEYKIRQDDQWTNSWGPAAAANTLVSSGAVGDGNIQLTTAGNYNISFVMPPTTAATGWLTTTTYTAVKQ